MIPPSFIGRPARLLLLFTLTSAVPVFALGWLGWRLLEQDRTLDRQRVRERLETGAALLAAESSRAIAEWEALLAQNPPRYDNLPPHSLLLVLSGNKTVRREGVALPYYPIAKSDAADPIPAIFATAEQKEFRDGGLGDALDEYRKLAATDNLPQRGAALVRVARCLRKQQHYGDALRVYAEIAALGQTLVAGAPAELIGRRERLALFKINHDDAAAQREAKLLATALQEGRYAIDRATFDFYRQSFVDGLHVDPEAMNLARAIEELWPSWQRQASGRIVDRSGERPVVAVWRPSAEGTKVMVGSVEVVLASALCLARSLQLRAAMEDQGGDIFAGDPPAANEQTARSIRDASMPWSIQVWAADPISLQQAWQSRRNLFVGGFALMTAVIGMAAYFVFRAVHRELEVARLQSDFVSAVSHEFRTPLTAMCHVTERLEENSASPERLPQYYRALARETRRLRALVESLLDFGRLQAGKRIFDMRDTDITELARGVVDEFRDRSSTDRLAWHAPASSVFVRADAEAIRLALRNLVDNALKYSPESGAVDVRLSCCGDLAGISVEDRGPGISKEEQRTVFRKFVRGEAARALNVRGTGIGLSLADQIVKAHGGCLELASDPGHGCQFTILLPMLSGKA